MGFMCDTVCSVSINWKKGEFGWCISFCCPSTAILVMIIQRKNIQGPPFFLFSFYFVIILYTLFSNPILLSEHGMGVHQSSSKIYSIFSYPLIYMSFFIFTLLHLWVRVSWREVGFPSSPGSIDYRHLTTSPETSLHFRLFYNTIRLEKMK